MMAKCNDVHRAVVLALVLLTHARITVGCPTGCQCMQKVKEHLTICMNTSLTEIPDNIPANTDQLHFKGNRIRILRRGSFTRLSSLNTLSLTHCQIEIIEPNAFSGLGSLAYLDLQFNGIRELQPYAFSGLFALKRLLLDNNNLTEVHNFAFNGLNLTRLRMERNPELRDISTKAFQGAKINELFIMNSVLGNKSLRALAPLSDTLRELSWQGNRQPLTIPKDLFQGFTFQTLKLNDNGITDAQFLEYVVADDLSLEGNPTGPIDFSHYPNLRQVRVLRLSRTGFTRVDGKYFAGLPHLAQLYLSENGIMTLPSNLQSVFEQLQRIVLDKNNIYCNCELRWFKRWLGLTRTFVQGATCSHPFLEDIPFIDESVMTCSPPKLISVSHGRNVSLGTELTLSCVARGNPAPTVTWHWPNGEKTVTAPPIDRNITETHGQLHIVAAQHVDQGRFRCDAVNVVGNVSAAAEILVYRVTYDLQVGDKGRCSGQLRLHLVYLVLACLCGKVLVSHVC
ncbi:hypothetical protein LSH36_806g00011 [Paralvinella palmiformis]|uniref:Ig-like domain-containing protein n=1 Tax=Paralvinella palmiformis TaxID=53620 RepID=A0AAD9MU26_9ANNE|nr:hypothetical protein LSH36_806g00011 [Paralvinella palmiformis]